VIKSGTDDERSRSSGSNGFKFWLPSLSSKSSSSSCKRVPLPSLLLQSNKGTLNTDRTTEDVLADTFGRLSVGAGSPEVACTSQVGLSAVSNEYRPPLVKETPLAWAPSYPSHAAASTIACPRPPAAVESMSSKQLDWETVQRLHNETGISLEDCGNIQNLLPLVPRNERGQLSSLGSISHASGQCCPCLFWFRGVCAKGVHCSYCHMWHKGQRNKRIRPSKKTRKQMRDYWEHCSGNAAPPAQGAENVSDEDDDEGHPTQCS